jgi:cytochrome b561
MKYSVNFRIWHWLNAFVILGLLGTVLLRKTFLSWRTNSEIIISKLSEFGVVVTQEQAKAVAKAIRAGMWEWHIILGYALALLVFYRIYLYFRDDSVIEKFADIDLHKKSVRLLYMVMYATLFFMSLSGFVIYFYQTLGLSKDMAHEIKEIHEAVYSFLLLFTPLHIAGVVFADIKHERGIISRMIHGREI